MCKFNNIGRLVFVVGVRKCAGSGRTRRRIARARVAAPLCTALTTMDNRPAAAPAPATSVSAPPASGPAAGAALLARSLLGPDHERAHFSSHSVAADGSVAPPSPSSSSSSRGRSASLSGQRRSTSRTSGATHGDSADGELEEPLPRNMNELNDMIQELQSDTHPTRQ